MNQTQSAPSRDPGVLITNEGSASSPQVRPSSKNLLVDDMAAELIARFLPGAVVADLGMGSTEVRARLARYTTGSIIELTGNAWLDASTELHIEAESESFDVVYCMRTFPHLGRSAEHSRSLARLFIEEAIRVIRPSGHALIHFYNPVSLLGMQSQLRRSASLITEAFGGSEREGPFARWDTITALTQMIPINAELVQLASLNMFPADRYVLRFPILGRISQRLNWMARDFNTLARFSGESLAIIRRHT